MTPHAKVYMKHFNIGEQDIVTCECCGKSGRIDNGGYDVHHINGRGKGKNIIENLALLCRKCHNLAHTKLSKTEMQYIHNNFLAGNHKQFVK